MNLISFLILLCLSVVSCHNGLNSVEINSRIKREAVEKSAIDKYTERLQKGMNIGTAIHSITLAKGTNSKVDAAHQIVNAVFELIPKYGGILQGLSAFMLWTKRSLPTDRQVILQEFSKVHARFDAIHVELDAIKRLVASTPFRVNFLQQTDNIKTLVMKYNMYKMTQFDRNDFANECSKYDAGAALNYFYANKDEIVAGYAENYDRMLVLKAMKDMAIICIRGIQMYEACEANNLKTAPANVNAATQYKDIVRRAMPFIRIYGNRSYELIRKFAEEETNIRQNFWSKHVRQDIQNLVNQGTQKSNEDFAEEVYNFLSQKYYWRYFIVGSYNGNTGGYNEHYFSSNKNDDVRANMYYKYGDNGRSWFVAMTSVNKRQVKPAAASCVNRNKTVKLRGGDTLEGKGCEAIKGTNVESCIRKIVGTTANIVCVKFGNGLRLHFKKDVDFYSEAIDVTHKSSFGMNFHQISLVVV